MHVSVLLCYKVSEVLISYYIAMLVCVSVAYYVTLSVYAIGLLCQCVLLCYYFSVCVSVLLCYYVIVVLVSYYMSNNV